MQNIGNSGVPGSPHYQDGFQPWLGGEYHTVHLSRAAIEAGAGQPHGDHPMRLSDFKALTFDCYGTLIDWETGIYAALQPLRTAGADRQPRRAARMFGRIENDLEAQAPRHDLRRPARGDPPPHGRRTRHRHAGAAHRQFGASVPDWPAFADSPAALQYLAQHYKLVILSNVDRESFKGSNKRLGVTFDAVYTAQDVGSYKPDLANFRYMLDHLADHGLQPGDILHTAQSLFHDHVPAKRLGLTTAWIDRRHLLEGWGATNPAPDAKYDVRFTSLAELAEAHRQEQPP